MTGRDRMLAATAGREVDRPPIWLREGFDLHRPAPFEADNFARGWQARDDYIELWHFARRHCDVRVDFSLPHFNRLLLTPPSRMTRQTRDITPDLRETVTTIHTPGGDLQAVRQQKRGEATEWTVKPACQTIEDLQKLRAVPFEVAPVDLAGCSRLMDEVGQAGAVCMSLSSPWVVLSGATSLEQALEWSLTERAMVHDILREITRRILAVLDAIPDGPLPPLANLGGSEQCTPPMMPPRAFAEFVTQYDTPIVQRLKRRGMLVNCHCHGRVANCLDEIIACGYDSSDPVEPAGGGGDVTIAQARQIVGDRLTLVGNLEWRELEHADEQHIRRRVREILAAGPRRLIVAASAGPISQMAPKTIANFRAMIEQALAGG